LNRFLTDRLAENNWKVLSPTQTDASRSAETLIEIGKPDEVVRALFGRGVIVTEKPEGIRAATHFFNDESDVERLLVGLNGLRG
jgi:selenocysteine lyase/cysteine desulfurase